MQQKNKSEKIIRDTNYLAPFVEELVLKALEECHNAGLEIQVFESIRSPKRQDELYLQGRTTEGKKVTNARGWQSFHNYGLAVDLAFYSDKKWSWQGDWNAVTAIFKSRGFETLSFEKAHFQISGGLNVGECEKIAKSQGILALWQVVERGFKK